MGCCSSNYTTAADANATINGLHCRRIRKNASKRSFSSRLSSASSGVFSRSTTPMRSSLHSRCSSPNSNATSTTTSSTPKPKPNNYKLQNCRLPKDMEMLSICDDFGEGVKLQQQQQQNQQLDTSFGYFTESISTGSTGSCTPTSSSKCALRYTRDASSMERAPSPSSASSCGNLVMEMYMMTHSHGLMAKTSSPKPERRCVDDNTFDVTTAKQQQQPSASYNKWCNYLQSTPAYMVHNLTSIPEAIAGHFCPSNFPAFVDVDNVDETSAAKRFKFDDALNEIEVEIDVDAADLIGHSNTVSTEL